MNEEFDERLKSTYQEYVKWFESGLTRDESIEKTANECGLAESSVLKYIQIYNRTLKDKLDLKIELTDKEEIKLIDSFRKHKAALESSGIKNYRFDKGWIKSKHLSLSFKIDGEIKDYEDIRKEYIEEMKKYAPQYRHIQRQPISDKHMLVLDPADIHFGKLAQSLDSGEDYTEQIAYKMCTDAVDKIILRTAGYEFDKIVLIIGNDILHTDNSKRTTTAGTPQDTDGSWWSNFKIAKQFYIETIEKLISVADVHVVYCPSNHDYTNGYFLADSVNSWFHRCDNVTFDVNISHRKYFQYGVSLIGATHGDGAKESELPDLMKTEAKKAVSNSRYYYWFTHHFHHKIRKSVKGKISSQIEKDYGDVTVIGGSPILQENQTYVEYLRSPSSTDSWHHRNGYQHARKAIEAFIFHHEDGQVARLSHNF